MKRILISIYAVCALLVVLGSLIWFAFTLYSDSRTGKAEALKNFKTFALRTGELLSQNAQNSDPNHLQTQLEQLCSNYQVYIQAALIRDAAGVIFVWPKNNDIFFYDEHNAVEVKNLPLFFTAAQMHIPLEASGITATVHTALQTIPLKTIFQRGQIVFFLLLLIVLLTITLLIFSYGGQESKSKFTERKPVFSTDTEDFKNKDVDDGTTQTAHTAESTVSAKNERTADHSDTESQTDSDILHKDVKQGVSSTTVSFAPITEQLAALNNLHIYENKPASQMHTVTAQNIHTPEPAKDEQREVLEVDGRKSKSSLDRTVQKNTNKPNSSSPADSLYADTIHGNTAVNYGSFENHIQPVKQETQTNEYAAVSSEVVNKQDLHTRYGDYHSLEQTTLIEELATAITETAATEEDLALLFIHASDITHNQHIIHLLRTTLDRIHKIFIYNKDMLGLIIFYAPLDQAMQIASNLYDEIQTALHNSIKKTLRIGLTTRADRLVSAPRMIEEAAAAVSKATEENSDQIVAFRVNPDKYRKYLTQKNSKTSYENL